MGLYSRLSFLSKYPATLTAAMFGAILLVSAICAAYVGFTQIYKSLDQQLARDNQSLETFGMNIAKTVSMLRVPDAIAPCSEPFLVWLERVAYQPDGIHEIIYHDDKIACSANNGLLANGFELGEPDLSIEATGQQLWLDRDLQILGHGGLTGTFYRTGQFFLVLPDLKLASSIAPWLKREMVSPLNNGKWMHRVGEFMLSDGASFDAMKDSGFDTENGTFWSYRCAHLKLVCVYSNARLADIMVASKGTILTVLSFLAISTFFLAKFATSQILRLWSFEARFARTMSYDSLVCFYQPLLSLDSGEIEGVEVLVRWKDIDGTLVFPDQFLPIVEEKKLTRRLTEFVVSRATADLEQVEFAVDVPRVNINIFPQDFEAEWLIETLMPMLDATKKLKPVVEIVETADLPVEETKEAVSLLRANGIETYIDDFGVGYSSIHYLSALGADGVKLDRSFAMAPDGCLNKTMLFSAIEMVSKTGLRLVVEGVEDRARLMELRATNKVDVIQGYLISPPLPPHRLRLFLADFELDRLKAQTAVPKMHADITAAFQ